MAKWRDQRIKDFGFLDGWMGKLFDGWSLNFVNFADVSIFLVYLQGVKELLLCFKQDLPYRKPNYTFVQFCFR